MSASELFVALVGRRTGVVRDVGFADTIDGDARLFHAVAEIANPHAGHEVLGREHSRVGGAGTTREAAITCAFGEAVERYAASGYPPAGPMGTRGSFASAMAPGAFARFSERQRAIPGFSLVRPSDATHLRWIEGTDLATRAPCAVPAFAVYMPYVPAEGEPLVDVNTTTGIACAPTLGEAIEKGAREVIERDAVALMWTLGASPPRIDPSEVTNLAGDLLAPRDSVRAFDVTTDTGVPVIFVLAVGEGPRGPIVSVGAACHPDPIAALRKAAMEASQGRVYVRRLVERDPDWAPDTGFTNVSDFSLHARLYSNDPELARRGLAFLVSSGDSVPLRRGTSKGAHETLAASEHQAVAVDLTPPWASPLGLHVARVVAPGLLPLHGHHMLRYEGHDRLRGRRLWPFPHAMP